MSRTRAATPAGKRRASGRPASRGNRRARAKAAPRARPAPKSRAPQGRAPRRRPPAGPRRAAARRARRRTWSRPRPLRASRRAIRAASWRYRIALIALLAGTLAAGYHLWLRDSSLVAVTDVEVVGVKSGEPDRIAAALTRAAERQTTLHVDAAAIEAAAAAYPTVESVSVDASFPNGMRIEVEERPPAMLVDSGGKRVPAAADGTLLAGVEVSGEQEERLPVLETGHAPSGVALDGELLQQALVLGAAPKPLSPLIETVRDDRDYGVEVILRGGIPVRFGSGSRATEKWAAAAAVLADPKLDSLGYLDVRVPERPAAGGAAEG